MTGTKKFLFWALIGLCVVRSISTDGGVSATVEEGDNRYYDNNHRSLRGSTTSTNEDMLLSNKKLNILAFGGSVTWGAIMPNRESAYPFMLDSLSSHSVHNLAIRATDSYFPSLCVQSMLTEAQLLDVEFDVIVLEFSINGSSGLTTLVKRLQYRYPDAVFIYVHLVSLKGVADRVDTESNPSINTWKWKEPRHDYEHLFHLKPKLQSFMDEIGAYVYTLPRDTDTNWLIQESSFYCLDGHHLCEKGHLQVANDLLTLLDAARFHPDLATAATPHLQELLHTWGEGDMCSDWLLSELDKSKSNVLSLSADLPPGFTAPVMREMMDSNGKGIGKFSLEFDSRSMITVRNTSDKPLNLYVSFMAGTVGKPTDNLKYTRATVTNNNDNGQNILLDPSGKYYRMKDGGVNKGHIRDVAQIGLAFPGDNVISIEPMDKVENNILPFRLIGVAVVGSSYNIGLPLRKPHNSLLSTTVYSDEDERKG